MLHPNSVVIAFILYFVGMTAFACWFVCAFRFASIICLMRTWFQFQLKFRFRIQSEFRTWMRISMKVLSLDIFTTAGNVQLRNHNADFCKEFAISLFSRKNGRDWILIYTIRFRMHNFVALKQASFNEWKHVFQLVRICNVNLLTIQKKSRSLTSQFIYAAVTLATGMGSALIFHNL